MDCIAITKRKHTAADVCVKKKVKGTCGCCGVLVGTVFANRRRWTR